MNKRIKLVLYLLLFSGLGSGVMLFGAKSAVRSQPGPGYQPDNRGKGPVARLQEKAQAAEDGDYTAIRGLVDEVFSTLRLEAIPEGRLNALKDRLARAEINYRNGAHDGIPEINVVMAINGLAIKLEAPAYAKTNQYEVRRLRMATLPLLPNLIARERPEETKRHSNIGDSIKPDLSPVEAAYVMMLMLQQKVSNSEYQVTFDERLAKWAEKHTGKGSDSNGAGQVDENGLTARQKEMQEVLERGASKLSPGDLMNIPVRALDILGIQK